MYPQLRKECSILAHVHRDTVKNFCNSTNKTNTKKEKPKFPPTVELIRKSSLDTQLNTIEQ
jgi:hypothetical protein